MAVGENTLKQIIAVEEAKLEVLKEHLANMKAGSEDANKPENKPAKAKTTKKVEAKIVDVDTSAFEEMTVKDLIALADANEVSVARAGKNKKYYIDRLVKAGVTPEAMNEPEEDAGEEKEANEYAGKTAKELFTLCKERGIECKPKQKADAYIALLEEADKADEEDDDWGEDDSESDDDWGEDEAEVEKPAKKAPAKKASKGGKKAPVKEVVDDDEDDDDWDI